MMRFNDEQKGWSSSILFHAILLLIFIFLQVSPTEPEIPQELELMVMESPRAVEKEIAQARVASQSPSRSSVSPLQPDRRPSRSVRAPATRSSEQRSTPSRSRDTREAAPPALPADPSADKSELPSQTGAPSTTASESRDRPSSDAATHDRSRENRLPAGDPAGTPSPTGLAPSIEWSQGVARRRIAGSLPTFPEGMTRELQIAVRFTVAPDGRIKDLNFVRKGEPRYEQRVLEAMRGWRFNALPGSVEQVDQVGKATFFFKLR